MKSKSCCKNTEILIKDVKNSVLDETQEQRDKELSDILQLPIQKIKSIDMFDIENIKIFKEDSKLPENEEEYMSLYYNYENLNLVGYLKLLMYTSVNRRGKDLKNKLNIANGKCLDYGSGVGTHSIYLMQRNNISWMYDMPESPLLDFALKRIKYRNLFSKFRAVYLTKLSIPSNWFDYVNCLDVLEHCFNPLEELMVIYDCLKVDGLLHLQVSEMVKPSSGHFKKSIDIWKIDGKEFLSAYFKEEEKYIYRKIKHC